MRVAAAALRGHWPEYLAEAAGLGAIMLVSSAVTAAEDFPRKAVPPASLFTET